MRVSSLVLPLSLPLRPPLPSLPPPRRPPFSLCAQPEHRDNTALITEINKILIRAGSEQEGGKEGGKEGGGSKRQGGVGGERLSAEGGGGVEVEGGLPTPVPAAGELSGCTGAQGGVDVGLSEGGGLAGSGGGDRRGEVPAGT